MSEPNLLTITYPNGKEIISDNEIEITWTSPSTISTDGNEVKIEIYFTEHYEPLDIPQWKMIAEVKSSETSYLWHFEDFINSEECRIAMRTRNSNGEASDWIVSASNFSIRRRKINSPTIIKPIDGQRINDFVEIEVDSSSIIGTPSQRTFLQVFYSSEKSNIGKTVLVQNYPIEQNYIWNTMEIPPSDDYKLEIYLSDDSGNISKPSVIKNLNIIHNGFFYIDTKCPEASIFIGNDDIFTNTLNNNVEVLYYDRTTDLHSMIFKEDINYGSEESPGDVKPFTFTSGDGVKTLELIAQDYGANRTGDTGKEIRVFQKFIETTGTEIVDIASTAIYSWAITSGTEKALYRMSDFAVKILDFDDTPTAIGAYKENIYVSTVNNNKGNLLLLTGNKVSSMYSFDDYNTIINSMFENNSLLYLGMENGELWYFNELDVSLVYTFINPIKQVYSDNNTLFVTLKNDDTLYLYNGTTFVNLG